MSPVETEHVGVNFEMTSLWTSACDIDLITLRF